MESPGLRADGRLDAVDLEAPFWVGGLGFGVFRA